MEIILIYMMIVLRYYNNILEFALYVTYLFKVEFNANN